ncbi:VLRF1 family aeRF1-type release factor [Streptomonospora sp. S1-112]|uniref:VLRF1 family aeRF1-type release factor n=1 Tax=Streptomonospora mangrovi TaxID=2883123 RepID=A0A9X3SG24_9ACTN|nr:VLRF1 family aeRF1-type release factor [Streptomonospora mangrovi]MDA0566442.1 VLRF1 family aeRF1-type release factor [Streptomonospora mangrovi]
MNVDPTSLRDLAAISDDIGVLTVYATADPRDRTASPAWRLSVDNALGEVRGGAANGGDKDRQAAVLDRLDRLRPEIDSVLHTTEPGVGRALFAPVTGDEVHTLTVQVPLDDCAVLAPHPYLRPLAAALTLGAPAGVVAVSHDGVRVIDLRFGAASEVTRLDFALDNDDWRGTRPAAAGNRGPGGGAPSRTAGAAERFDRRVTENLLRYLNSVRPRIAEIADARGWREVVVTGDARLLEVVREGLRADRPRRDVILLDRRVSPQRPVPEIAELVRPELEEARIRACRSLAERVCDIARSGGNATTGLSDTLGALRENRVAHLVMDGTRTLTGHRGRDGRYYPQGELPPGESYTSMAEELDLGERMIEMGLATGAEVTLLPEGAADALAEAKGVAALLRW